MRGKMMSEGTGEQSNEHCAESGDDDPAVRRAGISDWVLQVKGLLDDPWQAWYLLFVSILAVATQLWLRIALDGTKPLPVVPTVHRETQSKPMAEAIIAQDESVQDLSTPLVNKCEPFDEECHARMLAFAEGVSYQEDTSLFYTELKDWVLYMIFMVSLYAFSYAGLRRYQRGPRLHWAISIGAAIHGTSLRRPRQSGVEENAVLLEDDEVSFALCSLTVAVALGSVLLVPMTVSLTCVPRIVVLDESREPASVP